MNEIEPGLEIDNSLTFDTEPKMTRLDSTRMDRANSDLVDPLALDAAERKGRAIVSKFRGRRGILQQRVIRFWPELMQREAASVEVTGRHQSQQNVIRPL